MHDTAFDHVHVTPEEQDHLRRVIWSADNVEMTTVGIDVGSSTSHMMLARVHLQRLATGLSSRFVVVDRRVLWRSPILLTPYRSDFTIDADVLGRFIDQCFRQAGQDPAGIDSGAVILTGEALKRRNARAIADLFAERAGKFVCASAGHHLESAMAANGAGVVSLSQRRANTILNVDVGGGTTKLALVSRGRLEATAAIAVGGRLIVQDETGRIIRLEEPAVRLARHLGIELAEGEPLRDADRARIVRRMATIVAESIRGAAPLGLTAELMVTDPLPPGLPRPDAVTFSGGVSEYLFGREQGHYGDLGSALAHALQHEIADHGLGAPVWDPGHGIRATVIGASQFSVQVSGNTILVSDQGLLPLRNLPVVACRIDLGSTIDERAITDAVSRGLVEHDLTDGEAPVALGFAWRGDPSHARLHAVARAVSAAVPKTIAAGRPLVLLIDGDVARTLGRIIREEVAPGAALVSIDGVELKAFDYVDIGEVLEPSGVVTVVVKSLLF